jgi:CRP-like cAMP-binding protein
MDNPLIRKLQRFIDLSDTDRAKLEALCAKSRTIEAGSDIIEEDAKPEVVYLIVEGSACRYKVSQDGRRQIVAFLVPGDLCDLHIFILKAMDHAIGALTPVEVVEISGRAMLELLENHPHIGRGLWWSTLVDEATLRQWIVNVATHTSDQRAAHLFCELFLRLETVGLASGNQCDIRLRQEDISDAVGLTRSHLNASLQRLQEEGAIELHRNSIKVLDFQRLKTIADFNANYLHLEQGPPVEGRIKRVQSAAE